MKSQELFNKIAAIGVRIFKIELSTPGDREELFFVHPNKTTAEWRQDLRQFLENSHHTNVINKDEYNEFDGGYAADDVHNALFKHMSSLGYYGLDDVIADIFEGRLTNEACRIVDDSMHYDIHQNGFGHYGWDCRSNVRNFS